MVPIENVPVFLTTESTFPTPHSPEIWQETMSVLQDQCPKEDFETIKAIVSKELDFDNVFASFEEEPIGAASIGQGTLVSDSGAFGGASLYYLSLLSNID